MILPAGAAAAMPEILQAREERAERQRALLSEFGRPIVSFTMNIPGPVKDTPLIRFAFRAGLCRLRELLGEPVCEQTLFRRTGCEALLVYERPAAAVKNLGD